MSFCYFTITSAYILSLLEDLDPEDFKNSLDKLSGIVQIIKELKVVQANFIQYESEKARLSQLKNAT